MSGNGLVTVVICAYTRKRFGLLKQAIESVLLQSYARTELVVVIDHNDELLRDVAAIFPKANVIANSGPKGLSGARNTGLAVARGEIVCFIDDDAVAEPEWVAKHVRHYVDDQVIGTGGKIIPVWQGEGRPFWFPAEFDWVIGCTYAGHPEKLSGVRNPIGCNMSIRRSVLEQLGGFNTQAGRYGNNAAGCEETELYIRASQAMPGSLILFDPEAVVRHHIEADRVTWGYFCRRCWAEGRSKRRVTRSVGRRASLSSEQNYVRRVLPRAVMRSAAAAVSEGSFSRLTNAGAVMAGLGLTALGYLLPASSGQG